MSTDINKAPPQGQPQGPIDPPAADPGQDPGRALGKRLRLLGAAPAFVFVLAALLLLPGLGRFGLWDPQEIQKVDLARDVASSPWLVVPERHARPPLPAILVALGLRTIGTTEVGARLPVALCGLLALGALLVCGAWLAGRRAAALAALTLLCVPTFFLGARQVTWHIPAILGHILAVGGLCTLVWPHDKDRRGIPVRLVGLLIGAAGLCVGFFSLGAPLGMAAPLLAVALALAFWLAQAGEADPWRWLAAALLSAAAFAALAQPLRIVLTMAQVPRPPLRPLGGVLLLAGAGWAVLGYRKARAAAAVFGPALCALGVALLPALSEHYPGYSPWVGGFVRWPSNREIQIDSVLKPLGFQLFPFCSLLPLALGALLTGKPDEGAGAEADRRRFVRLVPLSWFSVSYVLATYHGAMVGDVPFPALGALALAAGMYLDAALCGERPMGGGGGGPLGGAAVALLCVLIGRDLFLFPEHYGSAHFSETLRWPAPLLFVAPVLMNASILFGGLLGLGLAFSGPGDRQRRHRRALLGGALGMGVLMAGLAVYGLVPALSSHVSYRGIFTRYKALGGGALGTYAVQRSGSKFYDQGSVDLHSVAGVFEFLAKEGGKGKPAFVMIGAGELAPVDQYARQRHLPYFVVDDSNVQFLLLSDRLPPGEQDRNPLRRLVTDKEPTPSRVVRANFDNKIELLGYDIPAEVSRGRDFTARLYYKVLQPVGGDYRIFLHIEGGGTRWNGDHTPLDGKFPTQYWVPGTYILDEHRMTANRMSQPAGTYQILTGFWPGGNGARLKVIAGTQDGDNRVKLGVVKVK